MPFFARLLQRGGNTGSGLLPEPEHHLTHNTLWRECGCSVGKANRGVGQSQRLACVGHPGNSLNHCTQLAPKGPRIHQEASPHASGNPLGKFYSPIPFVCSLSHESAQRTAGTDPNPCGLRLLRLELPRRVVETPPQPNHDPANPFVTDKDIRPPSEEEAGGFVFRHHVHEYLKLFQRIRFDKNIGRPTNTKRRVAGQTNVKANARTEGAS